MGDQLKKHPVYPYLQCNFCEAVEVPATQLVRMMRRRWIIINVVLMLWQWKALL